MQKYKERYKQIPDALAALGYDDMKTLADAMKRASKLDGPSLRDAIAQTKGLVGVTGTITIGPERNAMGKKLVIEEIKNGQLTLAATIDPATGGKVEMNNGSAAPAAATVHGRDGEAVAGSVVGSRGSELELPATPRALVCSTPNFVFTRNGPAVSVRRTFFFVADQSIGYRSPTPDTRRLT